RVSAAMTVLALGSGILLMGAVWPLVRRSRSLGAELVERNRDVLASTTGFLDGLKLVKAYGREQEHAETFAAALARSRAQEIGFARANGVASGVQVAGTSLLLAVTVWIAVEVGHVPVS